MQCLHYFLLGLFFQINAVLYGHSITIDRIFTDQYVQLWNTSGWPDCFAIVLAAIAGYVPRNTVCFVFVRVLFFCLFFIIDKEGDIDSVLFENTLLRSSRQYTADHQSMHSPERCFVSQLE